MWRIWHHRNRHKANDVIIDAQSSSYDVFDIVLSQTRLCQVHSFVTYQNHVTMLSNRRRRMVSKLVNLVYTLLFWCNYKMLRYSLFVPLCKSPIFCIECLYVLQPEVHTLSVITGPGNIVLLQKIVPLLIIMVWVVMCPTIEYLLYPSSTHVRWYVRLSTLTKCMWTIIPSTINLTCCLVYVLFCLVSCQWIFSILIVCVNWYSITSLHCMSFLLWWYSFLPHPCMDVAEKSKSQLEIYCSYKKQSRSYEYSNCETRHRLQ